MEHRIAYRELSTEARQAWETISGLALTTREQHRHAWAVLRSALQGLADDPHPTLYILPDAPAIDTHELFVSGRELAALRVLVAWLKANDRAGLMRDLPVYPDLAEAIVSQLGEGPWPGVWRPSYLDAVAEGGKLALRPRSQAEALARLLEAALAHGPKMCPGWSTAQRDRLLRELGDVLLWLRAMLAARDNDAS